MEELTDRIEREATELIRQVDGMGGAVVAIEAGLQQSQIQNAAYEFQRSVEAGTRVIVGVNKFQSDENGNGDVPVFRVDPAIERAQVARVARVRTSRDAIAWQRSIEELEACARGTDNLMPKIVTAAECAATVGEISDALRRVFGEYRAAS
jgi:methylmalonyl-CoA mutase N-terminal domain/subunit